jgi:hypothetical protein
MSYKPYTKFLLLCYSTLQIAKLQDFFKAIYCITTFIQLLFYSTIVMFDFKLWSNHSLKIFFGGLAMNQFS